jgi:hypothetical protein
VLEERRQIARRERRHRVRLGVGLELEQRAEIRLNRLAEFDGGCLGGSHQCTLVRRGTEAVPRWSVLETPPNWDDRLLLEECPQVEGRIAHSGQRRFDGFLVADLPT